MELVTLTGGHMTTKRKFAALVLVLSFLISSLSPWTQTTIFAENRLTLSIGDKNFYDQLLQKNFGEGNGDNWGALIERDDVSQEIILDTDKIKALLLRKIDLTQIQNREILETLIRSCTNLRFLTLYGCNLSDVDLSVLSHKESLTGLNLVYANLDRVPDITLPNATTLCLTGNNLSTPGAFDCLTGDRFPSLTNLWLDACQISDIGFVENLKTLTKLSIAKNKLTDESVSELIGMSEKLPGLQSLEMGKKCNVGGFGEEYLAGNSSNNFTNLAELASLPERFSKLDYLDLSGLRIKSLQEFSNAKIRINFSENYITDFAGLEGNRNFTLQKQNIDLNGNFASGRGCELPELIKRILDKDDVLNGELQYSNCSLSDDGTKIVIHPDITSSAYVKVENGRLGESKISFQLKKIPSYTIPTNLEAQVGDTLAEVLLPDGFTWKDSSQDVGEEGIHIFKAVYTPEDTDRYVVEDNIDLQVTVKAGSPGPAEPEEPEKPTEPEDPVKPEEPEKPTEPEKPAKPEEPEKPAEPEKPSQPPKPEEPSQPVRITEQERKKQKKRELALNAKLKVQYAGKTIKISWGKVQGAEGYDIYVQYCSRKFNPKCITTIKNGGTTKVIVRKITGKKLDLKKVCKVNVLAYTMEDGKKITLAKTITAHVVGNRNTKYTNVKAVKVNKSSYHLKKGGTAVIRPKTVLVNKNKKKLSNKHAREFRYETTNKEIATVSKKGRIAAVGKGSCAIYVYARNGYAKKVNIRVK